MLLNSVFSYFQSKLSWIYQKSFVLQKIDTLIFWNIIFLILVSSFAPSDNIGYFGLFVIILTSIKMLTCQGERFSLSLGDKFLLIYFTIVLISVAGSSLFLYSLKGFCKTLIYLGFYACFVNFIKNNKNKIKYIFLAIAVVVIGEAFVALKQNFLSVAEISGWQDMSRLNPEQIMTRVYGTLKPYNPNLFGGYLLATLPSTLILVYLPLLNKHIKTAICGILLFTLGTVATILTGCRGAYIALLAEFILLSFLTYRILKPYYKKIFITISSIIAGISAFVLLSVASLRARIFSIFAMRNDSSNSFRFNVYNSCIEMFKDNWLLGIGVGNQNFREIYGLYMRTGFDALSAYNIYLETAVESGIFALIAFLGFIIFNIYNAIKYIFKRKKLNTLYLTIALVSVVGILIHGFVDTVFFRPQIQFIFWIMMGIIRVITFPKDVRYVRARN